MNYISPFSLWIGNAADVRDTVSLLEQQIEFVVQLAAEDSAAMLPREIGLLRCPLNDGGRNDRTMLEIAIRTVGTLLAAERRTLVCCSAGMSRSPSVSACGLALATRKTPEECLESISENRCTDVSPPLWNSLLKVYAELLPT